MDPSMPIVKYPGLKGNLREMIRHCEKFRQDMLMQVEHGLDRLNKTIEVIREMDVFLQAHFIARMNRAKLKKEAAKRKRERLKKKRKLLKKKKSK